MERLRQPDGCGPPFAQIKVLSHLITVSRKVRTNPFESDDLRTGTAVLDSGAGELGQTPVEALEIMCYWLDRDGELLIHWVQNARRLGRLRAAYEVADLVWAAAADRIPDTR